MQFQKAVRSAIKLKIGIQGPSGAGKTWGALALAEMLAGDKRVAVIDTENGSASLYSDRHDFDTLNLEPPYTSKRYQDAIDAAVAAGYGVVIIDSMSHQWAGKGGILERKEQMDARGGNSFTNWAKFTPEHETFKAHILNAPVHIVATLRTKSEYVIEQQGNKSVPKKMGLAAIQREGMEYEFSIAFELQMDQRAKASKDRTGLFGAELWDLTDLKVGKMLIEWLSTAKPEDVASRPATTPSNNGNGFDQTGKLSLQDALAMLYPFKGDHKGKPLDRLSVQLLEDTRDAIGRKQQEPGHGQWHANTLEAIEIVLEDRALALATGKPSMSDADAGELPE